MRLCNQTNEVTSEQNDGLIHRVRQAARRAVHLSLVAMFVAGGLFVALPAMAGNADPEVPKNRTDLENITKFNSFIDDEGGMPFNIRADAMRQAALSYGARGGLAWRTYQIRQELDGRAAYLDKVFDFRHLVIAAPSGLLIEPPVISESVNALIIDRGGVEAAIADRRYEININARIVSAPKSWRNYLERDWGEVQAPPDILRPTEEERPQWIEWIGQGWEKGVEQADEIFEEDLNHLIADYQGMVRYRMLLAQGMVSPPYALQTDRGVTGDQTVLRVGDRAVQITGMPEFVQGAQQWQPASR